MRISDWSSDVCSSDIALGVGRRLLADGWPGRSRFVAQAQASRGAVGRAGALGGRGDPAHGTRSEEHTSELQSLMRISYAVFCLKKKTTQNKTPDDNKEMNTTTTNTSVQLR